MPKKYLYSSVLFVFAAILLASLTVGIFDVDSAQYASISWELVDSGNWLHFFDQTEPYLDKPPFLFWATALSFSLFGKSFFAFRLPSVLFALLGGYYLWLSSGKKIKSILVLVSLVGWWYLLLDIKTDVILMTAVLAGFYHGSAYIKTFHWREGMYASIWIAIGMMTKGYLGLLVPVWALLPTVIHYWKRWFHWRSLIFLGFIGGLLAPMLYGLYTQFDLHPEQWVRPSSAGGRTGVSGLRFYFWEQNFGRITGENTWRNDKEIGFLFHSFLLFFLPWSLPFLLALISTFRSIKNWTLNRWCYFCGFFFPLFFLSFSKYQLPHYVYVSFPFAVLFLTDWDAQNYNFRVFRYWSVFIRILIVLIAGIALYYRIFSGFYLGAFILVFIMLEAVRFLGRKTLTVWHRTALSGLLLGGVLMMGVGPLLSSYQSGFVLGVNLSERQIDSTTSVATFAKGSRAFAFGLGRQVAHANNADELISRKPIWVYTDAYGRDLLLAQGGVVVDSVAHYNANRVKLGFFDPLNRPSLLQMRYVVWME